MSLECFNNEFFCRYNLRRKSALRPSQSFDTMKSTASSVASDDTIEASSSTTNAKDHLDLATDFPPLSTEAGSESGSVSTDMHQFNVPKWVIKTNSDSNSNFSSSNTNSAVIDASDQPPLKLNQPPPDVTVVLQQSSSKQCTPGLPDIAAQAPLVMNTTNR